MPFNIDTELEKLLIMKADKQKLLAPIDAKIAEQEALILANVPTAIEGSKTTTGTLYKVTVNSPISRRIDKKAIKASGLSDDIASAFEYEPKLNLSNYRAMLQDEKLALKLSDFVTESQGKQLVKIDFVGQ